MTSREQFEMIFRNTHSYEPKCSLERMLRPYNFGTDDCPQFDYYSLEARTAWEWWQRSREAINIKLPKKNIGWDKGEGEDCWNNAIDACIAAIHAAGLKPRNG